MVILAISVLILIIGYVIFGSRHQRRLLINKFVIFLAVICAGILVFNGTFGSNNPAGPGEIQNYQKVAPPLELSPYVLQTTSRSYYVATAKDTPQALILTDYYYYNSKQWQHSVIPLILDKTIYGELDLVKRKTRG